MKRTLKKLIDLIISTPVIMANRLDEANKILEAENALAKVSNYDFVFVFKSVAQELSKVTAIPYIEWLIMARDKLMQGKEQADVLYYFDLQLERYKRRM